MKITKTNLVLVAAFILSFIPSAYADSSRLTIRLDLAHSDSQNLSDFAVQIQGANRATRSLVFEFEDSDNLQRMMRPMSGSRTAAEMIYNTNYPNGDFYYLIGDLDDNWAAKDYAKFYSIAKWLSAMGFRTIINVSTYISDLQEAVSNPKTSAIIWNSHGNVEGHIFDAAKNQLPESVFTKNKSPRLKYVLFANCYGQSSSKYYGLTAAQGAGVHAFGWKGTASSSDLFNFIVSEEFDRQLAKSLNVEIRKTPKTEI